MSHAGVAKMMPAASEILHGRCQEFKDAIASLSPQQQAFAKAFRSMQPLGPMSHSLSLHFESHPTACCYWFLYSRKSQWNVSYSVKLMQLRPEVRVILNVTSPHLHGCFPLKSC